MPTEMLRVETMSEAERTLIGLLTPTERRDVLTRAAQAKQRRLNQDLLKEYIQRVLRGEIELRTQTEDEQQVAIEGFSDSWVCKDGGGTFLVVADGICLSVNEPTVAAAIAAARAYVTDNAQAVADAVAALRQRIG